MSESTKFPEQASTGLAGMALITKEAIIKAAPNMYEILAKIPLCKIRLIFIVGVLGKNDNYYKITDYLHSL